MSVRRRRGKSGRIERRGWGVATVDGRVKGASGSIRMDGEGFGRGNNNFHNRLSRPITAGMSSGCRGENNFGRGECLSGFLASCLAATRASGRSRRQFVGLLTRLASETGSEVLNKGRGLGTHGRRRRRARGVFYRGRVRTSSILDEQGAAEVSTGTRLAARPNSLFEKSDTSLVTLHTGLTLRWS
jgi:hypothetical protein